MKLRNKKTGEIVVFGEGIVDLNRIGCKNVAEMIEAGLEDYEEPKGYWYINEFGTPTEITHTRENIYDKQRKEFGNYFETEEEAEKAVKKLEAWKRLKDKGFRLSAAVSDSFFCLDIYMSGEAYEAIKDDLMLLFGGEE